MKVFALGLSRTGTSSLTHALTLLGFAGRHYPEVSPACLVTGNLDELEPFDAVTDMPMPLMYRAADRVYPNSRFILTVRERDAWLDSCEQFFAFKDERGLTDERAVRYRELMYGTPRFDRARFAAAYDAHVERVRTYFAGRDDLLVLDVRAGDAWPRLGGFLGRPVPDGPFPHRNSMNDMRSRHRG